jgi:hypothetical protein
MITALPTLTISAIFLAWSVCHRERLRRQRRLSERVAYMLWAAAHADELRPDDEEVGGDVERRLTTFTYFHRR